jgi:hypothetical protein
MGFKKQQAIVSFQYTSGKRHQPKKNIWTVHDCGEKFSCTIMILDMKEILAHRRNLITLLE